MRELDYLCYGENLCRVFGRAIYKSAALLPQPPTGLIPTSFALEHAGAALLKGC